MKLSHVDIQKLFWKTALILLIIGVWFGVLASSKYLNVSILGLNLGMISLRPLHVTAITMWILAGVISCVFSFLFSATKFEFSTLMAFLQWVLFVIAIGGIFTSYFSENFGGREYWEFPPVWAFPLISSWILFVFNFYKSIFKVDKWPVYLWMWFTGGLFFLVTFMENYLWVFPFIREQYLVDTTIQWKSNGSLVGSWNQLIYGTAFYLMDKIKGDSGSSTSKSAYYLYFLGLFNLMFNWGHHIYSLPTHNIVKTIGYLVSMTEWVFLIKILYNWKKSIDIAMNHSHYLPFKFLMAADFWIFINLIQALFMSIPAINLFTHGTHVTVAHAMGTTIGINSMILLAGCCEFISSGIAFTKSSLKRMSYYFWTIQISLVVFVLSLNTAGIYKAIWQYNNANESFAELSLIINPWIMLFACSGTILALGLSGLALMMICQINSLRR
ncbi:MAG: cbb3-type cytochrome c oxidase subunit I [Bacteroidia bacterium]|jgi:nitric oxide reductase subunit B|nr:cbb3-type cytochrome c oxidase subunit I [Bacteroidota bacterium]MBL7915240.1 cbb3-type cytochrome c oxidase subunit I [Bacteroidia bacterium]MBP9082254.1 cbb3-type cytochrome c oxidase subunit I [Bacteroidia bacterium]